MVPRLRHDPPAARRVGRARSKTTQRGVQPAGRQEIPGSSSIHHGT